MDNSYDEEVNNTERAIKTIALVKKLSDNDLHKFYTACKDDILHNQLLFLNSKYNRLEMLDLSLHND